jgi:hypothetical protein
MSKTNTPAKRKSTASQTVKAIGSRPLARRFWCVMKAYHWQNLSVAGVPMTAPPEGPQRFIPVFDTREQAVAWAGTEEHVYTLE